MAEIVRQSSDVATLAKEMGIDKVTLYRKMDGTSDFYLNEIEKIRSILKLNDEDTLKIFFA